MKKIVFFMAALLTVIVFNFNTEAHAAKREHVMQNTTAYTGLSNGHGATYGYYNSQYNTVAVRKKVNSNSPIIPFGTTISLYSPLYLNGPNINKNQSMVTDTGAGTNLSSYWIDVYYGISSSINRVNAINFGNQKIVSYSAVY